MPSALPHHLSPYHHISLPHSRPASLASLRSLACHRRSYPPQGLCKGPSLRLGHSLLQTIPCSSPPLFGVSIQTSVPQGKLPLSTPLASFSVNFSSPVGRAGTFPGCHPAPSITLVHSAAETQVSVSGVNIRRGGCAQELFLSHLGVRSLFCFEGDKSSLSHPRAAGPMAPRTPLRAAHQASVNFLETLWKLSIRFWLIRYGECECILGVAHDNSSGVDQGSRELGHPCY